MAKAAAPTAVPSKIRIRIQGFDHFLVDKTTKDIVDSTLRTGARVAGPIPLPTSINRFTVLRSPHVNIESREQFEIRIHKRMIDIYDFNNETSEILKKMELPGGVDVNIKIK